MPVRERLTNVSYERRIIVVFGGRPILHLPSCFDMSTTGFMKAKTYQMLVEDVSRRSASLA